MKKEYISPEVEVQKFLFESILYEDTDDKNLIINDSTTEDKGFAAGGEGEGDI